MNTPRLNPPPRRKSGQTLIFMTMVIVMLAFAALFYFDTNKVLHVKAVSRNAGDAAALAGARWQAITLNLVGSLNVAQALAITDSVEDGNPNSAEAELISDLQRRITFSGPLFGFLASQQAAKHNGLFNNPEFENTLRQHASMARNVYPEIYANPFPAVDGRSGWLEYADMLDLLAEHGVAVEAPRQFYSYYEHYNHLLLNPSFYDAIAGRSWCWFYHNAYDELQSYSSWADWEPLPGRRFEPPVNSEINNLRLRRVRVRDSVPELPPASEWENEMDDLQDALDRLEFTDWETYLEVNYRWAYYNSSRWSGWTDDIPDGFPWDGEIREEYNYGGADAAVLVETDSERHTSFRGGDTVRWTAAAKPFGTLEGPSTPNAHGLVLPAFREVRLIPVDTSFSGGQGRLRPGWTEFILFHLPDYVRFGPEVLPSGNWYANQLRTWEDPEFRLDGVEWLLEYSGSCTEPSGGGGGNTGGTYHGH